MKKIISILVILTVLSSCMVGPKYSRPEVQAPSDWLEQSRFVDKKDSISNLQWFEIFKDSILNKLVSEALAKNYNMANAALRIEQSRAVYGIAKADLLPSVGYSAKAELSNKSSEAFGLGGTASWEIDFWGKLRHAKRAAYAEILASEEGMKTIQTILISDVASLYFQMRDLDNRLSIAKRTYRSRTDYLTLITARFRGGDVSELDMLQADQQLQIARSTVSSLQRALNNTERSMNVLLGQVPQSIPRGFANTDHKEVPLIPEGLPSSLLEQRPDIRQAEYLLQAETERIGMTQAMRFPSVNLTGFLGFASGDLSSLVSDTNVASNAAATILGPIFSFGANKRRVDVQRKTAEIAANNYVNTYFSALGEVENALVAIQTYSEEYEARKRQAEAASKSLMLSHERYSSGYTDYLEVLVAESAMFDSELQASATRAQQLSSYIQLYRSLGGGW
jgi:multidrug efflux system outer membrane protein